ncbi:hypothetical protein GCM10009092_07050 [Bowmanella denitrificans]|uniref:DUF2835 domain-containing protein n=1 Tax=Bowmanella denitrificans TaxID=366582 RepID=A0ABP3GHR4_9ALTE
MKTYFFNLRLSYEECRALYDGSVQKLIMYAESGERVQLPAGNLRPFINHLGIHGRFRLITNEHNKIRSFERVS